MYEFLVGVIYIDLRLRLALFIPQQGNPLVAMAQDAQVQEKRSDKYT